jgi:hypothetical protein
VQAGQLYRVELDGTELSTGVYLGQLQVGGQTTTLRLVLAH